MAKKKKVKKWNKPGRKKGPKHTSDYNAVCRDCKLEQKGGRNAFHHASTPRCIACGGILDRTTHLMYSKKNTKELDK